MSQKNATQATPNVRTLLQPHLPDLTRRYHIRTLHLFGSHVRGEAKRSSDIDLLIDFDRTPTLFELMDLEEELEEILQRDVDLVTEKSLRGTIGQRIRSEAVPV